MQKTLEETGPDFERFHVGEMRQQIAACLTRDQFHLHRLLVRLTNAKVNAGNEVEGKFWKKLQASRDAVAGKKERLPKIHFDQSLPIFEKRDQIVQAIQNHPVVVISGETGSGKSTQLPLIAMHCGYGIRGTIGHTQPRRIAARSIASRIASQLKTPLGDAVGFKIRFDDKTGDDTYLKLMTDGILLAETQSDRFLEQYEMIIIDEAHERSLNIDFLIGNLKRILQKRNNLKVIVTSATIDTQRFAEHFQTDGDPAPVINIEGRTYPVEIRYQPPDPLDDTSELDPDDFVAATVRRLVREQRGDVLVFLPTEKDIKAVHRKLKDVGQVDVLPLYARLSTAQQSAIFETGKRRRIVLATNVAESSITVPGIRIVVDSGTARISRYAPRSKVQRLPIEPISQASADQRAGRCGRIGPGICVRLFSQEDFESRPKFTTPEIRRTNLASVILQTLALKLGEISQFPFIDAPQADAIADGYRTLFEIGAIESGRKLTQLGRWLSRLPLDPRIGRIIHAASQEGCLNEILIIAAALEIQDPRVRPAEKQQAADAAHEPFKHERSDFMSYLKLWDFVIKLRKDLSRSKFRIACQRNFLSENLLHQWMEIHRQIKAVCRQQGLKLADRQDNYDAIHRSLLAGFLSGIAKLTDRNEYTGAGGIKFHLWPGSGVFGAKPGWIIAAEVVETNRRYGRTVAKIEPTWIEPLSPHLAKSGYVDPHWSKKRQTVMAYQNVTLFGLPIVNRRRVGFTNIDPEQSRELFIDKGLCEFELSGTFGFLDHNRQLQETMEQLAAKTRRRDLVFDTYKLREHYYATVPTTCFDTASLKRALRADPKLDQQLRLNAYALNHDASDPGQFPDRVRIGSMDVPVQYRFEPGQNTDGASIQIPEKGLSQIDDITAGWLIPGMYEHRITALIKSLPKSVRRNFVPAAETAKRVANLIQPQDESFPVAVARALSSISGETVSVSMFEPTKLDDALSVFIQVVGDHGEVVAEGRSANDLRKKLGTNTNFLDIGDNQWNQDGLKSWTWGKLPDKVQLENGVANLDAFPAIVDQTDSVGLRLVGSKHLARRLTQIGIIRLFCIRLKQTLKKQVNWLPDLDRHSVSLARFVNPDDLKTGLGELIVKIGLIGQPPVLPADQTQFEAAAAKSIEPIAIGTQEVAKWLPKFAIAVQQANLAMEEMGPQYADAARDVQDQMQQLLAEKFLLQTPWQWLQHYPRYFDAIAMRCQKLKGGGLNRDADFQSRVSELQSQYRRHKSNQDAVAIFDPELEKLRWMIEEYRVSLFAQQLGTCITVSDKRLSKQLSRVRQV